MRLPCDLCAQNMFGKRPILFNEKSGGRFQESTIQNLKNQNILKRLLFQEAFGQITVNTFVIRFHEIGDRIVVSSRLSFLSQVKLIVFFSAKELMFENERECIIVYFTIKEFNSILYLFISQI